MAEQLEFTDDGLREIIHSFTREAGVRNLEREIATITRKQARRIAEDKPEKMMVTPEVVREYLGVPKFRTEKEVEERVKRPGVAVGLVWTPVGGDIIFIEATRMRGGKQFTMTGHLGEVMQESMTAALTWIRANGERYGIDPDFFRKQDIHIHVPSGAVPKDGPSAGAAMVTALVSLLSGRPVRDRLAMTGEMTLSGIVLPIGGVKEKVLGAKRAGITRSAVARGQRTERGGGSYAGYSRRHQDHLRAHAGRSAGARAGRRIRWRHRSCRRSLSRKRRA